MAGTSLVGFALPPPKWQIVDGDGLPTPEFYRYLVQITELIGGYTNPFDDAQFNGAPASQPRDIAQETEENILAALPVVPPDVLHDAINEAPLAIPPVPRPEHFDETLLFLGRQTGSGVGFVAGTGLTLSGDTLSVNQSELKPTESLIIACSDESTAITAGTSKITFRMPYAFTLTGVRASVTTAPTGAVLTIDINEGGVSILSTKLTIDVSEKTSTTAATPAVISDTALADDAEMTVDFDTVGSTIAGAGVKVTLIGSRT